MEIYVNVVEWGPGIYGAEVLFLQVGRRAEPGGGCPTRGGASRSARLVAAPPRPPPARPQRRDPCKLAGRPHDAALALRARRISRPALSTSFECAAPH